MKMATPIRNSRLAGGRPAPLLRAPDGGDDFVGISGPGEGFGHLVGVLDEAVDGGLKIDDGSEDAALQSSSGQFGEEALDRVERPRP